MSEASFLSSDDDFLSDFLSDLPTDSEVTEWAAAQAPQELRRGSGLRFRLGAATMAIPSHCVKAVAELRAVCTVPYRRKTAFLGLVAYGGEVLPCCSLARLLGVVEHATGNAARTLILEERAGERWAMPVDAVLGMMSGKLEARAAVTALPAGWAEQTLREDGGAAIDLLLPEALFARFARAVG